MRKEGLLKDNRNGLVEDADEVNGTHDPISDTDDDSTKVVDKDGDEDPLATGSEPAVDPFDTLLSTPSVNPQPAKSGLPNVVTIPSAPDADADTENDADAAGEGPSTAKDAENGADEEGYEVQEIVDHKYKGKRMKKLYLIRWQGYGPENDTWEPEDSLMCPDIVAKYLEAHPGKVHLLTALAISRTMGYCSGASNSLNVCCSSDQNLMLHFCFVG